MSWSSAESRGEPDEVGFGSSRPPRPRWPRWPLILAGAAVIAAAAAVLALGRHPVKLASAQSQVTVTDAGHRLLGVRGGWELLGYGPNRAVRVQLARGRVTQTLVPSIDSTGPVSFVTGPAQTIIRPLDVVPGYLVPDGKPARPLRGMLSHGGSVIPGPRPGEVWLNSSFQSLALVRLDGSKTGVSIHLPPGEWWLATPNGRGYVLLSGVGEIAPDGATAAIYRVTPGGQVTLHLLSLATGTDQQIAVRLNQSAVGPGTLAWSPDSRWLFVVTAHGGLAAVNAATRHVEGLGVRLPWLSQIATRPG